MKLHVHVLVYSYWLGSRTTAVLFGPRMHVARSHRLRATDPFMGQSKYCCWRSQSITVLLYTIIVKSQHVVYSLFIHHLLSHVKLTSQCRCVVQILGLDGQGYWKHLLVMWVERVNEKTLKKMKEYNKTVIDWLLEPQQFGLTLERICCLPLAASGNRSVCGSNKTAVVLEPSQ